MKDEYKLALPEILLHHFKILFKNFKFSHRLTFRLAYTVFTMLLQYHMDCIIWAIWYDPYDMLDHIIYCSLQYTLYLILWFPCIILYWITSGGPRRRTNKYGIYIQLITIQQMDEHFVTNPQFKNSSWFKHEISFRFPFVLEFQYFKVPNRYYRWSPVLRFSMGCCAWIPGLGLSTTSITFKSVLTQIITSSSAKIVFWESHSKISFNQPWLFSNNKKWR